MNLYEEKQRILAEMPFAELLAGLAEEAAELGQAALKYRRAIDCTNPTPVTPKEAQESLFEEIADVTLYLGVMDLIADVAFYTALPYERSQEKLQRWLDRLKGDKRMSSPALKIRRLDSGKFLATVGKKSRVFDTLPEAAVWAEKKLVEPAKASPEDVEKFWQGQ